MAETGRRPRVGRRAAVLGAGQQAAGWGGRAGDFAQALKDRLAAAFHAEADSGRLAPRHSFVKRPGIVTFRFGAAIPPGLKRAEIEEAVHEAINALETDDA